MLEKNVCDLPSLSPTLGNLWLLCTPTVTRLDDRMTKSGKRKLIVNSRIWKRSLKHLPDSNDTTVFKNIFEFIQITIKDCCIYFVFGVISTNQDCIDIRSSYKTKNKKKYSFYRYSRHPIPAKSRDSVVAY